MSVDKPGVTTIPHIQLPGGLTVKAESNTIIGNANRETKQSRRSAVKKEKTIDVAKEAPTPKVAEPYIDAPRIRFSKPIEGITDKKVGSTVEFGVTGKLTRVEISQNYEEYVVEVSKVTL